MRPYGSLSSSFPGCWAYRWKKVRLSSSLFRLLLNIDQTHLSTFLLGAATIAIILVTNKFRPRWPGTLLVMILVGQLVFRFELDRCGLVVVGAIPGHRPRRRRCITGLKGR